MGLTNKRRQERKGIEKIINSVISHTRAFEFATRAKNYHMKRMYSRSQMALYRAGREIMRNGYRAHEGLLKKIDAVAINIRTEK